MCAIKALNENDIISDLTIEALVKQKLDASRKRDKSLVVSVVGAGGKTSLIYHLASQLKSEFKILVTTTTMMFKPIDELDQIMYQEDDDDESVFLEKMIVHKPVLEAPQVTGLFLKEAGEGFDIDGRKVIKVKGVAPTLVDQIAACHLYDLILVEADGSRRRPLKAYAVHEPVLPPCSDVLMVVMGLKGFNAPITEETIHRLEAFLKLTGKKMGDYLQMEDLLSLFRGEEGFLKAVSETCDVVALFNQADSLTQSPDFFSLSEKLFNISPRIRGFFVVSLEQTLTYAAFLNQLDGER